METAVFDADELPLVLSVLRGIVPRPMARHHRYLDVIARLHGGLPERRALPPAPHMLVAGVVRDPRRRQRLVELSIAMAMIDPRSLAESAPVVADLARALEVDEPAVRSLSRLASQPPLALCASVMCRTLTESLSVAWRKHGFRGLSTWIRQPLSRDQMLAAWSVSLWPSHSYSREPRMLKVV